MRTFFVNVRFAVTTFVFLKHKKVLKRSPQAAKALIFDLPFVHVA